MHIFVGINFNSSARNYERNIKRINEKKNGEWIMNLMQYE